MGSSTRPTSLNGGGSSTTSRCSTPSSSTTTFYRLPTAEAVEKWAAAARPGFVYAVKLGAFGSHRMKLRDPASWMANHLDRVRRLGEHLGPNLVQLPPRWKRNVDRLDEFLSIAPPTIRWAVELREPSWLHRRRVRCAPAPRRRALHPRPVGVASVRTHRRLDVRAIPRARRAAASVPRFVRRGSPARLGGSAGTTTRSRAATCTPTSTTTGTGTPSPTPCSCVISWRGRVCSPNQRGSQPAWRRRRRREATARSRRARSSHRRRPPIG